MKGKSLSKCIIAGVFVAMAASTSCSKLDEPDLPVDRGEEEKVVSPSGRIYFADVRNSWVSTGSCSVDYYAKVGNADVTFKGKYGYGSTLVATDSMIPYKDNQGIREIDARTKLGEFSVFIGDVPTTVSLPVEAEVFSAKFNMNGQLSGVFIPGKSICAGTTSITSWEGEYSTKETSYLISFTGDDEAQITVKNAKFAQNMPAVGDMIFSGLDVSYNAGGFVLTAESLIPSIAGVPYPSFEITDLKMDVDLDYLGDADLTFKCGALGRTYRVTANDMCCLPLASGK